MGWRRRRQRISVKSDQKGRRSDSSPERDSVQSGLVLALESKLREVNDDNKR